MIKEKCRDGCELSIEGVRLRTWEPDAVRISGSCSRDGAMSQSDVVEKERMHLVLDSVLFWNHSCPIVQ